MKKAQQVVDMRPLIVHVLFRFDTGGLENGVVNLLNRLPSNAYRHAVVALDEVVPEFAQRVQRDDVEFHALRKPPGQTLRLLPRLYALFRRLRPAIVHTRNLAALECQLPAWMAGVDVRIHGEHGRDMGDLDGRNPVNRRVRRLYRPLVQQYVALSRDLESYLTNAIGVSATRVRRICNGVDSVRFAPARQGRQPIMGCPFNDPSLWLAGTVGRAQPVKNQVALAQAFVLALQSRPDLRRSLRLVIVGEGPQREACRQLLLDAGVLDLAWLAGERADVPDVMRGLDCFVLPSLAEGVSNTILEAMSCGLPILATDVGGNADLVIHAQTGLLVPAADVPALSRGLLELVGQPARAAAFGSAGRDRVEREFSLDAMVSAYGTMYEQLLRERRISMRS